MFRILFLSVVTLCASTPCLAGWQNTEWGMSLEEVKKIVGENNLHKPSDAIELYELPYSVGIGGSQKIAVRAFLNFSHSTKKLSSVNLLAENENDCDVLLKQLTLTYGTPILRKSGSLSDDYSWADEKHNNSVNYSVATKYKPVNCSIRYAEQKQKNEQGGL